jgi:archaea-specific RecJ-like exonuclease
MIKMNKNFKNNKRDNKFSNKKNDSKFKGRRDSGRGFAPRGDKVNTLGIAKAGDYFEGVVKIVRKSVPGPVVFSVSDGFKQVDAVTMESKFDVDDVVTLKGPVNDRANKLQIEIKSMEKSNVQFEEILNRESKPIERYFSIKSERLNKMRPRMIEIAKRIRKAVLDGEAIMIRHHFDTDGISSGLALEHSIKILMTKAGINPQYYLYRSPSKAPFYEITDMLRDIAQAKRIVDDFGQKKPLMIVVDNGSTPEDAFSHKTLHNLGYDIIVIDHHNPTKFAGEVDGELKTSVCEYLTLHLNPYMFGLDSETNAGMLCYEIGRLIDKDYDEPLIPAVSAISDRSSIDEKDEYIKMSEKSVEELTNIGIAIDFASYNLRFSSGKGLYEEIFNNPVMVDMMAGEVAKGMKTQLQSTLPYVRTREIKNVIYSNIDLEKYTMRFTYPNPGKVIGMIHDTVLEAHPSRDALSIGYLSDMLIVRANKPVLPVATIIKNLQEKFPEANVDGGGHECAGAIKFVSAHRDAVLEEVKNMLKELPEESLEEE